MFLSFETWIDFFTKSTFIMITRNIRLIIRLFLNHLAMISIIMCNFAKKLLFKIYIYNIVNNDKLNL